MFNIAFNYIEKERCEEIDEEGIIEPFFYYKIKHYKYEEIDMNS